MLGLYSRLVLVGFLYAIGGFGWWPILCRAYPYQSHHLLAVEFFFMKCCLFHYWSSSFSCRDSYSLLPFLLSFTGSCFKFLLSSRLSCSSSFQHRGENPQWSLSLLFGSRRFQYFQLSCISFSPQWWHPLYANRLVRFAHWTIWIFLWKWSCLYVFSMFENTSFLHKVESSRFYSSW